MKPMNNQTSAVDLHMHTTFSDGKLTPTQLVRLLVQRKVTIASITDHDSTEGLSEAFNEAELFPNLELIPGIEISADHPWDSQSDLHVLGYFIDIENQELQKSLIQFRHDRDQRAEIMVARLGSLGIEIDFSRVQEIAGEAGIGRPHIAEAMVEKGYIKSVPDAFNGYLNDGGLADVSRPRISMERAVELITNANGVAVLAHPIYATDYEKVLDTLSNVGFVGFEVHYANFNTSLRNKLLATADRLNLLPCGGSDYHGTGTSAEHLPGSAGPPESVVNELKRLAKATSDKP